VLRQVEGREHRVRVVGLAVYFHSRPDRRLAEDQVGEGGDGDEGGVDVEELAEEGLGAFKVDIGVEVEPFEVDVYDVEVLIPSLWSAPS
jgi:hypothetical protein